MVIRYSTFLFPGERYGILYRLKRGQGISMHAHKGELERFRHHIWCFRGAVRVTCRGNALEVFAGHVLTDNGIDFDSSHPHEIVALEDDTVIANVSMLSKLAGGESPAEKLEGTIPDNPLTFPLKDD